jgi:hypothetical protein
MHPHPQWGQGLRKGGDHPLKRGFQQSNFIRNPQLPEDSSELRSSAYASLPVVGVLSNHSNREDKKNPPEFFEPDGEAPGASIIIVFIDPFSQPIRQVRASRV